MIQVTNSILLKSISLNDAPIIYSAIDENRTYLREWLPFVDVTVDKEYTQSFVENTLANKEKKYLIYYQNKFGGLIGLNNIDLANNKAEIGYRICEKMQEKGLAIQSVAKLLAQALDKLNLNKVTIKASVSNYKSRKIPEKLNFIFEGIEREGDLLYDNKYTDLAIYSLLRKEYKR